jgi:hypothetical protein
MAPIEVIQKRIEEYLKLENFHETIGLIEDELEEIINDDRRRRKSDSLMKGNGNITKINKKGYVITDDEGTDFFAPTKSFKGDSLLIGDRVQFSIKQCNVDKKMCYDFMKCMTYDELIYNMFFCIESHDMIKASSYAWAIYVGAEDNTQNAMKLCIHTLRNYIRDNKLII